MKDNRTHKIYGVIGTSLKHSLSPMIHDYLNGKCSPDSTYTTFEIDISQLADAIKGIRSLDIKGISVTYPFKESVIKYLDKLDKTAESIDAVNTIKNVNGKLTGYNTDTFGIRETLRTRLGVNPRGKNIMIIGAGGAAKACLGEILKFKPANIFIVNRTKNNAKKMINMFNDRLGTTKIKLMKFDNDTGFNKLNNIYLIINAISARQSVAGRIINHLSKEDLLDDTKLFDLNYGNRALSKNMPQQISICEDGLFMLVAQAVKACQIWHGKTIDPLEVYKFVKRRI